MDNFDYRENTFSEGMCIHEIFELQVEQSPHAPAIVFQKSSLSYLELDQKANQLAHYLQQKGVGPEVLVAIAVERSLEMIIGILGILKAGGAYVPLDPKSPKERLQFMLEDTAAPILLTQAHLFAKMPNLDALDIIALDQDWKEIEKQSPNKPITTVREDHLIYTIYTSGSTGQPKGVQIEHRNVRNLVAAQIKFVQHPVKRFLYAYSFAFDGAVLLIYWTLLQGATLIIAEEELEKDIRRLSQFIKEHQISHLLTFASLYALLLDQGEIQNLQSLESVSVAGEVCPPALVKNHHRLLKGVKFLNQYGPTEATVGSSIYLTSADFDADKVPIGKAINQVQLFLLNDRLEKVAVGETGEIFIGGKGVARAYLNRPKLTQQKFIANPFGRDRKDRLYRSGDLARWLPDGNIDFIGRADDQVKLRGYRIELGEVEAVIGQHPNILETAVLLKGKEAASQKLVAYLVLQQNKTLTINEIRDFIGQKIQDYMIPAHFMFLEKMPLTTAGKVDRKALPKPLNERPKLRQKFVQARSDLEQYLTKLWCETLDLNTIGIHDKFFELGGNSLQAAQFINRVQERLGETIFTLTIFDNPTIASFALMLERDYQQAVQQHFASPKASQKQAKSKKLSTTDFEHFDQYVPQLIPSKKTTKRKNPPAIFILAPPRSGTSLLRIMLAGHPDFFAANELQLLGFQTLKEREEAYAGKFSLWKEGLVRTVMELDHCTADEAKNKLLKAMEEGRTTQEYYAALQQSIAPKILVDKSPSYALDLAVLQKAEQDFSGAIYIHLLRHPFAMVRSFERMHMDQAMYLHPHPYEARQLGELIWTKSHQNIQQFLSTVPEHRQFRIQYENLVQEPQQVMEQMCAQLGFDFHPNLIQPYRGLEQKMVDGIYRDSKPMGDVRLLEHGGINPKMAEAWKGVTQDNFLSQTTWDVTKQFNYKLPAELKKESKKEEVSSSTDIAIIGMSGRFPGAKNIEEFWQNLKEGTDVSQTFTAEELQAQGLDPNLLNDPDYVNRGMLLDDADCFDAPFFGYHPKEAMLMDPQHRIFLECAYAALEDAGYDPANFAGDIGVFGGVARNTYLVNNVMTHPQFFKSLDDFQLGIALEKDFPATRVAYQLNLKGPAVNIQTACSSSGVAVHLACQSLLAGDCDMVIVGGGRIQPPLQTGHFHKEGHALSPDGYCRTFDADASGMVRGNGMAFIVIKRSADALADGDQIHALIKGTAINNDGSDKIGFTAPSIKGQAKAIEKAYRKAKINPATVSYIECHGTGTALGDPIEMAGLTTAFAAFTDQKGYCAVGSVKTNIGHLDAGACVAGIIKTVLSLKNELLPATLHYQKPNPQINFAKSPFFVNDRLRDWKRNSEPRRAGVSSFGLGGTNAHVVLEEAPKLRKKSSNRQHHLIVLSAKTQGALDRSIVQMADFLENKEAIDLNDIAATLQLGRKHHTHRASVLASDLDQLKQALSPEERDKISVQESAATEKRMVFLFPGGGAQHTNMGKGLYEEEPIFRAAVDRCLDLLQNQHQLNLRPVLFPDHDRNEPILNPLHAITLLFTAEYATAQLLLSWGLVPSEMIGHSLGEYTAACIAKVFSVEDALALVTLRGRLFQTLEEGAMLSVPLSPETVGQYMEEDLSFAAINKPDHCVVSGSVAAIDGIKQKLNRAEIHSTRLHIKVAAHSHMIEPILNEFGQFLDGIAFGEPTIPIVSNLSGKWVGSTEVQTSQYWKDHLRQTVHFSDGIETILNLSDRVLLEVGPGQTLSTFARQHPAKQSGQVILAALKHPKEQTPDTAFLLKSLGKIWQEGIDIDWPAYHVPHPFRRSTLPTYPFEKKSYWLTAQPMPSDNAIGHELNVENMKNGQDRDLKNSVPMMDRKTLLLEKVKDLFQDLSGIEPEELHANATFLELGFDSLFLTQAAGKIKKEFKVKLSFRQLFEEAPTLDALAIYIDEQLAPEVFKAELDQWNASQLAAEQTNEIPKPIAPTLPTQMGMTNQVSTPSTPLNPEQMGVMESLFHRQLQIMEQQLALMRGGNGVVNQPIPSTKPVARIETSRSTIPKEKSLAPPPPKSPIKSFKRGEGIAFGPWQPIDKKTREDLTEQELKYLDELVKNYIAKTKGSQSLTQAQRPHLADPRAIVGFNRIWKDMVYQIAIERSKGAKLWDVDGNEYVDYRMAFGISLFGHTPDFIQKAVAEQLEKGTELGVLTPLARKVADLLCELTGTDRATLVNTGSEAISASIRAARTVTGKDKIVVFEGDYHGIADEMLVKGIQRKGETVAVPIAPGIPTTAVENIIILDYDDPEVLSKIEAAADDLAAVIIEPIQPNNPHRQHKALFHAIRAITTREDIALIFDEMITGFRVAPKGAQQWFDIEVDLIAYGKIISGGLPMAVVAGKSRFMDAFDGGQWQYGDESYPEAGVTFFGGTFVKHPLSLAAAYAALSEIKKGGQALFDELNLKTAHFAERLNELFVQTKVPLQLLSTASIIAIKITDKNPLSRLFFYYLRLKGIHIKEKAALLSTAHTEEELDFTYRTMEESIQAMLAAGFFIPIAKGQEPENKIVYPPNLTNGFIKKETLQVSEGKKNIPLTEGQKEVWVEQRLGDGAAAAYNLSSDIRLQGSLQVDWLQKALQLLVDRHEALRTTYDEESITQNIRGTWPMDFPLIDLSDLSATEKIEALETLRREEAELPIDIFAGPPFRAKIIRIQSEEHHLFLSAHHGVSDGWSCGVLVRDLSVMYSALSENKKIDLPVPKQISAYALEHDAERDGEERKAARDFWVKQFENGIPVLELPTDRSRPPVKTYDATCEKISIDDQLFAGLKNLATKEGSTMFVLMYAAFQTFIHRLSGQNDFVLGMVAAGQSIAGNADLVTHGVSLLPLRMEIDPENPFAAHLKKARGHILDAFEHQNYTLGSLVKALNLPRDMSRQPIMSILFNMDSALGDLRFGALQVEQKAIPRNYETFDIFINVKPTLTGIDFEWTYNTDLFDQTTIQRRLIEFKTLLESIVANAQTTIGRLSILPTAERKLIMEEWTNTRAPYPDDRCIHEMFEEQMQRTPDLIAVESQGRSLTYQELNEQANQLAHLLIQKGVQRGDFVGIFLDRSVKLLVGLMAILKAGGIYVPLDPSNPKERLKVIIEDAESAVLITEEKMMNDLPTTAKTIIVLERAADVLATQISTTPQIGLTSQDLAYVIYTSGSTGRPKGIVIPHNAVLDHHFAMIAATGIDENDIMLSVASVSFDPSVQDFFLPLFIGGRVVIASSEEKVDGFLLKERMQKSGINFIQATPATWRMLIMSGWEGHPNMKLMNMGEALTKELSQQLIARGKELWNAYGPSETTIYTTVKKLEGDRLATKNETGYETLGFPINNAQVYILDPYQTPVPIGVVGELYVGGVGLAPGGYLKRPELNQEKFVSSPFDSTETLYRSGDLARYLPDGDIEFMGRIDHQVKVRGFRIELGEIESLLAQYPGIAENTVVVREDQVDNKRIVAYVVMDKQRNLETNAIKRYLKARLPEYMVPSAFVQMDQFPLTSSLKVNRKVLPIPDYSRDDLEIGFLAPRTDIEKQLAEMWAELLGISEPGINDNFFELGGHSLIAVNMMAKIEQQFERKLPLSVLLENATIKRLAYILDQDEEAFIFNSLIPIKSSGSKTPIYLIHGAGLHVLLFQTLAAHMDEEQPIYALQARGMNGEAEPLDRIEAIAAHYISEIVAQNPDGPYALAGYSFGGLIAFEMAKQLEDMGKEIVMLGMFDTVVRAHLAEEKENQSYYSQLASVGKKVAWNISLITKNPIPNLRYKSHVLKRRLQRWKWSFTHNETEELQNQETDHGALVDRMNQIAFENYQIKPWNREIHLFRAKEQRFFLEDFEFLGWKPFALGGVIVHDVPGDHLTLFNAPYGAEFATILQKSLDQTLNQRNCALQNGASKAGHLRGKGKIAKG